MRILNTIVCCIAILFPLWTAGAQNQQPLPVAIVGLTHGHVAGFLPEIPKHPDIRLVGIVEQDAALVASYKAQFPLDTVPVYTTINELMEKQHPAALLVYTAPSEHRRIIQDAAAYGVSVMVEKPLATTMADALAIRNAARQHRGVQVIVNYETTWYASNHEAIQEAHQGTLGNIWKVVIHDGHRGPREIGVQPEFLNWITDPAKNGAGALFDFGCYGADLMTVLMNGQAPISVTAVTQTNKPHEYPRVDDDATVILRYPGAQAVLQPSWNWPFDRKDMEVYGTSGYAVTAGKSFVRARYAGNAEEHGITPPALLSPEDDPLHFLEAAISGKVDAAHSLGGIDTNIIVMQILDAARQSAKTGRSVTLHALPND